MEAHRTDSEKWEKVENTVKTARLELTLGREKRQKRIFKRERRNQKRIKGKEGKEEMVLKELEKWMWSVHHIPSQDLVNESARKLENTKEEMAECKKTYEEKERDKKAQNEQKLAGLQITFKELLDANKNKEETKRKEFTALERMKKLNLRQDRL